MLSTLFDDVSDACFHLPVCTAWRVSPELPSCVCVYPRANGASEHIRTPSFFAAIRAGMENFFRSEKVNISEDDPVPLQVWDAFFSRMFQSIDVALCEGWISKDDISEPFLQLGMPAAAVSITLALCTEIHFLVTAQQQTPQGLQ